MGFKKDAFATSWSVEPVKDTITRAKISISKKNKATGEYESDFNGFVSFVGTASASKAAKLKERDRIKLGDVDVTRKYDKEKQKEYINFNIFSFEMADNNSSKPVQPAPAQSDSNVDDGEFETSDLPF